MAVLGWERCFFRGGTPNDAITASLVRTGRDFVDRLFDEVDGQAAPVAAIVDRGAALSERGYSGRFPAPTCKGGL